jgi:hypothetical protein
MAAASHIAPLFKKTVSENLPLNIWQLVESR